MFERYTEKARRVIFFARYEASHYGSAHIDTQHLLLGLMRENMSLLVRFLPEANLESVRTTIDARATTRKTISTAIDLPLSEESKRVLVSAAEEADRLAHKHIGTEHLFLGLVREENCLAAQILRELGADASKLRVEIAKLPSGYWDPHIRRSALAKEFRERQNKVEIHGSPWNADYVRDAVGRCRQYS
jgi:ATP-dependent Clp protease ATP-binding subunit ClpC